MKIISKIVFLISITNLTFSQELKLNSNSSFSIFGTSTLHDWEVVAEQQSGTISIDFADQPHINKLEMVIQAESLKSGKTKMDKNTYKALKTSEYKTITFKYTGTKDVKDLGNGKYDVTILGNLTVAGVTKPVAIKFILKKDGQKLNLTGQKHIRMTDFNVDPPTALLGTIKTGDDITLKFNSFFH